MNKHKRGESNSNQMIQWVLVALIVIVVFNIFDINIWAFWWIPFVFICMNKCGRGWSYHEDEKSKNDDIDYV